MKQLEEAQKQKLQEQEEQRKLQEKLAMMQSRVVVSVPARPLQPARILCRCLSQRSRRLRCGGCGSAVRASVCPVGEAARWQVGGENLLDKVAKEEAAQKRLR